MTNKHRIRIRWFSLVLLLVAMALAYWYIQKSLSRPRGIDWNSRFPGGIVIHHTATAPVIDGRQVDAAFIDEMHQHFTPVTARDGTIYHIAYHYVILQDGVIMAGRPEYLPGGHAKGYPNYLGIVLVGDFHRAHNRGKNGPLLPTDAQMLAAERLTRELLHKYHMPASRVFLHRDLRPTACPGDAFPADEFLRCVQRSDK